MSVWLVDSSVWIDYFNGTITPQTDLLDASLGKRELALGDLILCEVLQGFARQSDFELARDTLLELPVYPLGGIVNALKAAENFQILRRRGVTVRKTIDCLIATFALEHGLTLLHSDGDFDPFAQHLGLMVAI